MQTRNSHNNPAVVRPPQVPQNGHRNNSNRNLADSYEFLFHEDAEDKPAANSNYRNVPRNNPNPTRNQPTNVQRKHCLKVGCQFFGDESYGGYCSGCFLEMTKEESPGQSECNSCNVIFGRMKYVCYRIRSGYMSDLLMLISRQIWLEGSWASLRGTLFVLRINVFVANVPILCPLKTWENSCVFYDFLNGNIGQRRVKKKQLWNY